MNYMVHVGNYLETWNSFVIHAEWTHKIYIKWIFTSFLFFWHQLTGYICSTIHNYITFTCSNSDEKKNNCTMSNVYIYIGIIIKKKRDILYKLRRLWQKKTTPEIELEASSSGNSCKTIWVKQIKSPKSGNKEKEIRQIPTLKLWTVYDSRRGSFRQIKPLLWFICKEVNTILTL